MGKISAGSIPEFWLMKLDGMRFSLVLAWVGAAELQFLVHYTYPQAYLWRAVYMECSLV